MPSSKKPGSETGVEGVIRPSSSAAIPVISLKVDPVGYVLLSARLVSGALFSSEISALYSRWLIGLAKTLAS